jgi:hypothetical protein
LFEKLHADARFKDMKYDDREKIRMYKEMMGCSFQPSITLPVNLNGSK